MAGGCENNAEFMPRIAAKNCEAAVLSELGKDPEKYLQWIKSLPFYLNLPECLVLHAGLKPGIPLERQNPEDLTNLRTV